VVWWNTFKIKMKKIKNIVIVGGGTAGWITAHNFLNKTSKGVKVTVVAAPEIPTIGVGESTTGQFNALINLKDNTTDLNEKEFLKETQSTFKLGIKHTDWHTVGKSFYSPLADNYYEEYKYPHWTYDNYRIYHVANNLAYDETLQSQLMINGRVHYQGTKSAYKHFPKIAVAYHLDTYKVGNYLKRKATSLKKCNYVKGEVVSFQQDSKGYIKSVKTKTGELIKGDLFIDCSGFSRVLIDKAFSNKFISYQDNLLVNRALTFNTQEKKIKNYTHAWAQRYGWLWQIPTQQRLGCGYVYSDNFINVDKAQQEIESVLGHKITPQKDIKFHAGRLENFWIKNVLSTGLSSAFVEPLEATSIHATLLQITHFIENYYKEDLPFECELLSQQYNSEIAQMWDTIRDFIIFHYITPRKDTRFWIESSSEERRSDKLKNLLNIWKHRMPRTVDYGGENFYNLNNGLWYQIAIGMKLLNPTLAKKELKDYGLYDSTEINYKWLSKSIKDAINTYTLTNDYYASLFEPIDSKQNLV